jgi:hypothetical protein
MTMLHRLLQQGESLQKLKGPERVMTASIESRATKSATLRAPPSDDSRLARREDASQALTSMGAAPLFLYPLNARTVAPVEQVVDFFLEHLDQNVGIAAIRSRFPLPNNFPDHCGLHFQKG